MQQGNILQSKFQQNATTQKKDSRFFDALMLETADQLCKSTAFDLCKSKNAQGKTEVEMRDDTYT